MPHVTYRDECLARAILSVKYWDQIDEIKGIVDDIAELTFEEDPDDDIVLRRRIKHIIDLFDKQKKMYETMKEEEEEDDSRD